MMPKHQSLVGAELAKIASLVDELQEALYEIRADRDALKVHLERTQDSLDDALRERDEQRAAVQGLRDLFDELSP